VSDVPSSNAGYFGVDGTDEIVQSQWDQFVANDDSIDHDGPGNGRFAKAKKRKGN